MESPERPHIRLFEDDVFVERVPNYWVRVTSLTVWMHSDEADRHMLCGRARKLAREVELPPE